MARKDIHASFSLKQTFFYVNFMHLRNVQVLKDN